MQLNNSPLVVEQNHFLTKNVNAYTVCDLDNQPKVPVRSFTIKNCLFCATTIVKNSDKEKWLYSGYGIAFDGKGEWSFGNDFARAVVIFGVDTTSTDKIFEKNFSFQVKQRTTGKVQFLFSRSLLLVLTKLGTRSYFHEVLTLF